MLKQPHSSLPAYESLQHWRGIAVLWVVLFHGFGTTYAREIHPIGEAMKLLASPGWLGVHIFFVVSGYCIAANVQRLASRGLTAFEFVQDRLLRIMPTYWAALATTIVLNLMAYPFNSTTLGDNLPQSPEAWLGNLFLVQPYLDVRYYLIIYWSLVVELGFYAIVAVLWLISRLSLRVAGALFAATTLASVFVPAQPNALVLACWPEFACGILAYGALSSQAMGNLRQRNAAVACIVALGAVSAVLTERGAQTQLWFAAIVALLLLLLHRKDREIVGMRSLRWLAFAGLISYSAYLVHIPFGGKVIGLGSRFVPVDSIAFLILQVGYWAVGIGASYAFYLLAERRFERWRHARRGPPISKREALA